MKADIICCTQALSVNILKNREDLKIDLKSSMIVLSENHKLTFIVKAGQQLIVKQKVRLM